MNSHNPQSSTRDTDTPDEPQTNVLPKSIGMCPYCGTEQVGAVYRISARLAAFLKVKRTDTFVPDEHRCIKKVTAQ